MKVRGFLIDWQNNEYRKKHGYYGAVSYYRLVKPLQTIGQEFIGKEAEKFKGTPQETYDQLVKGYDILVTTHLDSPIASSWLMFMCRYNGVRFVIDLDDNLFAVQPHNEAYKLGYQPRSRKKSYASAIISLADALIVSTEPLKEYYTKRLKDVWGIEKPIFVNPNRNDIKDFNFKPYEKFKDAIVIGWAGSTSHNEDLKMVMPVLNRLLHEYPKLYLEFLAGVEAEKAPEIFKDLDNDVIGRMKCMGGTLAWKGFPEFLSQQRWNIAIAPLVDDEFNKGKSHIKWMEYSMYKIPTVASKVYPYYKDIGGLKTIQDGKTGFLAKNQEEWYQKLKKLIDDEQLRLEIGQNAYDYVKNNWQYEQAKDKIEEIYKEILKIKPQSVEDLKQYAV